MMDSLPENYWSGIDYVIQAVSRFILDLRCWLSEALPFNVNTADLYAGTAVVVQSILNVFCELFNFLSFDEFQITLLTIFSLTFVGIVAVIFATWEIYGPRVTGKFMYNYKLGDKEL